MTKFKTADRGDIRDLNILAVINLMRRGGAVTRAGIARDTGLSAPTVSAVIGILSKAGLIDASGAGPATGGRRGELLALRADAKLVLAVDLSCEPRRCALIGLTHQVLDGSVVELPQEELVSPRAFAGWLAHYLRQIPRVIAIAIAAPGITNAVHGVIEWAPTLGWREAPVKAEVQAACPGVVVVVENDLNLAALGEHALGRPAWTDLAMLGLRGGFGAGVILGGNLHRGINFAAGELGYLPASLPFGRPGTLDFGSLETTLFSILPQSQLRRLGGHAVAAFRPQGDALAPDAADHVTDILAVGSFALAVVLDLAAIIVGEELLTLIPDLDRRLERRLVSALPHPPQVAPASLGAFGIFQGASAAVQREIGAQVRQFLI